MPGALLNIDRITARGLCQLHALLNDKNTARRDLGLFIHENLDDDTVAKLLDYLAAAFRIY